MKSIDCYEYRRNIKCIVQYDGTNYKGWQIQKKDYTIQGIITDVIKRITREDVAIQSSGRTDTGVHAIGQVIAFKTNYDKPLEIIKKGINALLPPTIRIIDICDMPLGFHPRYDARSKTYFYVVCNSETVSAFLHPYVWHVKRYIDVQRMVEASGFLVGRKDFRGFMASGSSVKDTVRNLMCLKISEKTSINFLNFCISGNFIIFEFKADGFLRHMVRNMVGMLVEIGLGRLSIEHIEDVLRSKDRRLAGISAPAKGLFLYSVEY